MRGIFVIIAVRMQETGNSYRKYQVVAGGRRDGGEPLFLKDLLRIAADQDLGPAGRRNGRAFGFAHDRAIKGENHHEEDRGQAPGGIAGIGDAAGLCGRPCRDGRGHCGGRGQGPADPCRHRGKGREGLRPRRARDLRGRRLRRCARAEHGGRGGGRERHDRPAGWRRRNAVRALAFLRGHGGQRLLRVPADARRHHGARRGGQGRHRRRGPHAGPRRQPGGQPARCPGGRGHHRPAG